MEKIRITKRRQLANIVLAIIIALTFFLSYAHHWNKVISTVGAFRVGLDISGMIAVLMVMLLVYWDNAPLDKGTGLYFSMVNLLFIDLLGNAISWCIDEMPEHVIWLKLVTVVQLLVIPFLVQIFFYYQKTVYYGGKLGRGGRDIFVHLITVLDVIVILGSFFFPYYFNVNEMGIYTVGPAYSATFYQPIAVLTLCGIESIRTKFPIRKKMALMIFSFAPVLMVIVTLFTGNTSYVHMVGVVDMFLLYSAIQGEKAVELSEKKASVVEKQMELDRKNRLIMVSQIQPHFIFNTLSSIRQLCKSDEASAAILDFSNYLRMNLETLSADSCIPFEKELEHTKEYVRIEMLRFGDRVNVCYNIETVDFEIPPLTLQPIVENAIKHGVCQRIEGGTVEINVRKRERNVVIEVNDNGVGFNPNEVNDEERNHVGMKNVKERLEIMSGGRMVTESMKGVGTLVQIIIPDISDEIVTEKE